MTAISGKSIESEKNAQKNANLAKTDGKFTTKQWIMLALLALINLGAASVTSLLAPFFPAEAERKGATPTEYGFIIGTYQLVIFLVSPIYGKFLIRIGPRFLLFAGIFTMSTCSVLFGMLNKVNSRSYFVLFAFLIRMVQGMGQAGFITSSLALIAKEFPNSVPTTFSLIQTFFGIGILIGPSLGGALYEVGGYMTPFVCMGAFLFVTSSVTFFFMPKHDHYEEKSQALPQFWPALKIPVVFVSVFTTFCGAGAIGFISATLEPHLRQFGLKPSINGLMFIISGVFYSATASLWGRLCRWASHTKILCGIAALLICLSFTLLGPAPFLPLESKLWLCIIALGIHGMGVGGELVCGFLGNLKEVKAYGYPDTLGTFGLMSSMWTSSTALGGFVGSSVGGTLLDHVGFRMGTLFIIGQHGLLALINFGFGWHLQNKKLKDKNDNIEDIEEKTPLISELKKSQANGTTKN
ncbi:hypothetical protein CHUAL_002065 [Chamberlinius hualienensis]